MELEKHGLTAANVKTTSWFKLITSLVWINNMASLPPNLLLHSKELITHNEDDGLKVFWDGQLACGVAFLNLNIIFWKKTWQMEGKLENIPRMLKGVQNLIQEMLWRYWESLFTLGERKPMGDIIMKNINGRKIWLCVDPKSEPKTLKGRHLWRQMNGSEW